MKIQLHSKKFSVWHHLHSRHKMENRNGRSLLKNISNLDNAMTQVCRYGICRTLRNHLDLVTMWVALDYHVIYSIFRHHNQPLLSVDKRYAHCWNESRRRSLVQLVSSFHIWNIANNSLGGVRDRFPLCIPNPWIPTNIVLCPVESSPSFPCCNDFHNT